MALLLTAMLYAQPKQSGDGPPKPPPVAERWKHDSTKLQLYINMQPPQISGVKNVFTTFYKEMDALREGSKGGPPKKEEMDKIRDKRKTALKTVLNDHQMQRFQTFEKQFMPPHHPPGPKKEKPGVAPEKL